MDKYFHPLAPCIRKDGLISIYEFTTWTEPILRVFEPRVLFSRKEDSQMHDLTIVLAIFAVVVLAYQSEIDDRPAVQDEDETDCGD